MGKLLSTYRKSVYDDIIYHISSNTAHYYAFISSPLDNANNTVVLTNDDYSTTFEPIWKLLFGKKITSNDIMPVIYKNIWIYGKVFDRYDNLSETLRSNNNFYCISQPAVYGGDYIVYKCIDNANGGPSTIDPGSVTLPTLETTFQTSDDYKWRYICSTTSMDYNNFSIRSYFPIEANAQISSTAASRTGLEVIAIRSAGIGYETYNSGYVQAIVNSTVIQLTPGFNRQTSGYFDGCDVYFNTGNVKTSEIKTISQYVSNNAGCFVYLSSPPNTANFTVGGNNVVYTSYSIAPRVEIETDGTIKPSAYCTIDANNSNSIASVTILETGNNITWANVKIVSTIYGSGANLYCIVPPPGGHGADPSSELEIKGLAFSLNFSNTESNTILGDDVVYNKFGILKDPYILKTDLTKGSIFTQNTFNQTLSANLTSPTVIPIAGDTVIGSNSGARGIVALCNSTVIHLTGDHHFIDGEAITTDANVFISTIDINSIGDIYARDQYPLYVQNISTVNRSNTQTESFKLIIKV